MKDVGREIAIFKSEDGIIWQEHRPPVTDNDIKTVLSQTFEGKRKLIIFTSCVFNLSPHSLKVKKNYG